MTIASSRRRRVAAVALVGLAAFGAGAALAVSRQHGSSSHPAPGSTSVAERPAPARGPAAAGPAQRPAAAGQPSIPGAAGAAGAPETAGQRTAAVEALLAARSAAVLGRDRSGFLSTVDPTGTAFAQRQAALFDDLADVPLAAWTYTLHTDDVEPADPALDARYGTWWAPRVVLGVALQGIDVDPAESDQALTFVRRGGHWYVAADDDFAAGGHVTAREVWDGGPVTVVHGASSLVLGHPAALPQLHQLATDVDAAVPRVTAVWGTGWTQRVAVVVPADQAELGRLVSAKGSLTPIAALAVAGPVRDGFARGGDRILINPTNLARLDALGRRIVLTHEVTHVATRSSTGPATPIWLSEGLADHDGYLGTGVPVATAAAELRSDIRAGRLPAALPAAGDWTGDNPDLSATYEQAWLAVELMVRTYGQPAVLTVYRDLGGRDGTDPAGALDQVLRADLGTGVAQLTAAWRADLRRQLG